MNILIDRPQEGQEAFPSAGVEEQRGARVDALATVARLRKEAAAEIERLLAFMDESDGYTTTELEQAADDVGCDDPELEPSLCGLTVTPQFAGDDLEEEHEDEPSLGSLSSCGGGNQAAWGLRCVGGVDAEDEHDGAEPDVDDEPSLGWTVNGAIGNTSSLDFDCEANS